MNKLNNIVETISLEEGLNTTNIPFVKIFKSSISGEVLHTVYELSLFIILKGLKTVISSTFLAVSGKIIQASMEEPFISI